MPWRTTFSTASKKSRSVATFRRARIANMRACVATDWSSAPIMLGHSHAIRSKRMLRSTPMLGNESQLREFACREWAIYLRVWMRRMCARPSLSGSENSTRRSRRPGHKSAGFRVSSLIEGVSSQRWDATYIDFMLTR